MPMSLQFVIKPLPGSDLLKIIESAKVSAKLWKKHGATDVTLWAVTAGEVGNMAFTVQFENFTSYGASYDKLSADPEFRKWQSDVAKLGMTEWVSGNVARAVPLD